MSPKRRGMVDDRWERTGAGLFVPRRPTLPTRRFVVGKLGGIKCCCANPLGCDYSNGPFVGTAPTSILLDVSGVVNDVCEKCAWMNGSWEIPWWSASSGGGACAVYYTHVFDAEESDRDTCCYPFTSDPDVYSVSVSFTINTSSGFRNIAAGVQAHCALVDPESISYNKQESTTEEYSIDSGTQWTIPFTSDHDCDGSIAVVTVEIP